MISVQKILTRIVACIAIETILFMQTANAQNSNPCSQNKPWGEWHFAPGYQNCADASCGVGISFKDGICLTNGGVCGVGLKWRWCNNKVDKDGHYEVTITYRDCGGQILTSVERLDLDKTGVWEGSGNYFAHAGKEPVSVSWQYLNPNKDKAKQIKDDVNDAIKNYNQQYNDAINAANKVKDPAKHNQFVQQINANKDAFHQLDLQAQAQINTGDGDALASTLNKMKKHQTDLHTIYLRIDPDEPTTTAKNNSATATDNTIQITTPKTTTTNTTTVNNNSIVLQQTQKQQQTVQMLGALSTQLSNFANAYGASIDANYANWKAARENAFATIITAGDSVKFYEDKAKEAISYTNPEKDTLVSLQYSIKAHWFRCQSEYNGSSIINNTKYGRSKDITTGDYVCLKYNPQFSSDNTHFNFIALEQYVMPDVLFMPICRLSDTKIARQDNYRNAFGYINNCTRCSNLKIAGGQNEWLTEKIKCNETGVYNEIAAAKAMQQNLYDNKIENNIDLLDYATTRTWYNNLKLKNAKTLQDIIDLLKANEAYLNNNINRGKTTLSLNERRYFGFADIIANYYLACAVQVYCSTTKKYYGLNNMTYTGLITSSLYIDEVQVFATKELLETLQALLKDNEQ